MKFPLLHGRAVYAGYKPTSREIQTARAVDVPVKIRVNQLTKWKYQAFFDDMKPRQPVRTADGRPIRGDLPIVLCELAQRFDRLEQPYIWYAFKGERAPYAPTARPKKRER
jgi:hypothetical protein